jgi:hypothetical protein
LLERQVRYLLESLRFSVSRRHRSGGVPHRLKRRVVRSYQRKYGLRIFVETGTYLGDMTAAMANYFDQLYTIELGADLYRQARARFRSNPPITLHQGDSARILEQLFPRIDEPPLFWLHAHYSHCITVCGTVQTPIERELELIIRHPEKRNVILIDDARRFKTTGDYPTLEGLAAYVGNVGADYTMKVAVDIIRLRPRGGSVAIDAQRE